MWLICKAALGRGKNKLLVRGVNGAEWVFCPLIKSMKSDRVSTDRCQGCQYFLRLQEIHAPQTQTPRKTLSLKMPTLKSRFHIRRPLARSSITRAQRTFFPQMPTLTRQGEPFIDIFQEDNHLVVLAELLGIEENDVNVTAEGNTVTISAENAMKKYLRKVRLPIRVRRDTMDLTYRNNILCARFEKLR